jgi:hypothetical protein
MPDPYDTSGLVEATTDAHHKHDPTGHEANAGGIPPDGRHTPLGIVHGSIKLLA